MTKKIKTNSTTPKQQQSTDAPKEVTTDNQLPTLQWNNCHINAPNHFLFFFPNKKCFIDACFPFLTSFFAAVFAF